MDNTYQQYLEAMQKVNSTDLGLICTEIVDFCEVFPHSTMEFKKEKADNAAFNASSSVWKTYPDVVAAQKDITDTLYLACNEVFVEGLCNEVAKLQVTLERLREAYNKQKGNMHLNQYWLDNAPVVCVQYAKLKNWLVTDLKDLANKFGFEVDVKDLMHYYVSQVEYWKEEFTKRGKS